MKIYTLITVLFLNSCMLFAQVKTITKKINSSAKSDTKVINDKDGGTMLPTENIATNIAAAADLSTFYKIVQQTGLKETFRTKGPVTVFVPDNQAFANLSKGKLDSLLMPARKYDLIALVAYHTLAGKVTAKNISRQINSHKGLATFTTLTGNKLMARWDENKNIVLVDENGGKSTISKVDIQQNNGLVYITNAVLIPKFKNI